METKGKLCSNVKAFDVNVVFLSCNDSNEVSRMTVRQIRKKFVVSC